MTSIKKLPPYDAEKKCVNVIVETPKGSRVKYAYDPQTGFFILSKSLPEGMMFPFNFGFIPNTLAEDGDPLDLLILNEEPLIAGCLLKVKPVAVIKATQTEEKGAVRNDRIIGQAINKETPLELQDVQFDKRTASQIGFFFTSYNKLYGKKFKIIGTGGRHKAHELIDRAIKRFQHEND